MKKAPSQPVNGPLVSIVKAGDGITARELPTLEAAIESWGAGNGMNDFDRRVRLVEGWASAVLQRAGISRGAMRHTLDDTVESIALRILRELDIIRISIASGDAAGAARGAVNLGVEMGAASVKFQWEKYALKGLKLSAQRGPAQLAREIEGAIIALGENATPLNIEGHLVDRGLVRLDEDTGDLIWENAQGEKRLKYKSFETKISGIKNRKK